MWFTDEEVNTLKFLYPVWIDDGIPSNKQICLKCSAWRGQLGLEPTFDLYLEHLLLIFDEVKTGLTAGHQGAAQRLGVTPDLTTLAKSIGGGLTLAAFGGKKKYMDFVTNGKMAHFGTFNGNPLAMAGVRAADVIFTEQSLAKAEGKAP